MCDQYNTTVLMFCPYNKGFFLLTRDKVAGKKGMNIYKLSLFWKGVSRIINFDTNSSKFCHFQLSCFVRKTLKWSKRGMLGDHSTCVNSAMARKRKFKARGSIECVINWL